MRDDSKPLPPLEELLDGARRASDLSSNDEHNPTLAEKVLRELQTSSTEVPQFEPLADWLRVSKWAAALACAAALAIAAFSPEPSASRDKPNALSALGGW